MKINRRKATSLSALHRVVGLQFIWIFLQPLLWFINYIIY